MFRQSSRAEMIKYSIPLDMTRYLNQEEEYTPWDAAYDNIIWLREMLRYRPVFAKLRVRANKPKIWHQALSLPPCSQSAFRASVGK